MSTQDELLDWARNVPLVRWSDGLWRGLGAKIGDDEFEHDTVMALVRIGKLELTSAGATLKQVYNLPFEHLPQCACDPGIGTKPPSCTCGSRADGQTSGDPK